MQHDFNPIHLLRAIRLIPSTEINTLEKLILYTLLSCANLQNDSWYSQESLAEMTSTCSRTIRRVIKDLVQKKFILVKIPSKYYRGSSNHYALNIDHIMFYCPSLKGTSQSSFNDKRGTFSPIKGDFQSAERGTHSPIKKQREETKEDACARDPLNGSPLRASLRPEDYYVPDEIWAILGRSPRSENDQETH